MFKAFNLKALKEKIKKVAIVEKFVVEK